MLFILGLCISRKSGKSGKCGNFTLISLIIHYDVFFDKTLKKICTSLIWFFYVYIKSVESVESLENVENVESAEVWKVF